MGRKKNPYATDGIRDALFSRDNLFPITSFAVWIRIRNGVTSLIRIRIGLMRIEILQLRQYSTSKIRRKPLHLRPQNRIHLSTT